MVYVFKIPSHAPLDVNTKLQPTRFFIRVLRESHVRWRILAPMLSRFVPYLDGSFSSITYVDHHMDSPAHS